MKNSLHLSDEDGIQLVKFARKAVSEYLKKNKKIQDSEFNSKFNYDSGVFVTINKSDSLRGCIGFPLPSKKLCEGLVDAAISAATQDPRFSSVRIDELNQIVFEVTVLTPPVKISVENPMEYLSMIKIGRDGLIVENEYSSGLLLPQVPVEYGWSVSEFLCHTCEKAGLDMYAWKDKNTIISRFEGIIFKEETTNGNIMRKSCDDFL